MAQENPAFAESCTDIPLGLTTRPVVNGASPIGNGPTVAANKRSSPEVENLPRKSVYTVEATCNSKPHKKDIESDNYDPHDHCDVAHPTSNMDTLFHLLKGCFGTGILAMPEAFKFSGYIVGVIGTAFIGFMCTLAVHMLIRSEYELSRRRRVPTLTYPQTAVAALQDGPLRLRWLSKYIGSIVNMFIVFNQMGACTVYIIFVASNIKDIMDVHAEQLPLRAHMAITLVPLILLAWVRDLKYLAPFSTLATTMTLTSFGIILYYLFREVPSFEDRVAVGSVYDYPLFIGTAVFSLEAIGVMMPLKNEMKTPRAFGGTYGVLNRAMVPIVFLFVSIGLCGYLTYGPNVQASVTLDLPKEEWAAQAVKLMMAFAIFVSHALMNYVTFDIMWTHGLQPRCEARKVSAKKQLLYEYLIRTGLVIVHFTLGAIFQNLGLVISLIGAFCLSTIGLALPALIHCTTFWYSCKTRTQFVGMMVRDGAIFIFAGLALVIGTYISIRDIVKEFR